MPTTMQLISAQTLTTTASSIIFSNIPQTFTDLKIIISDRTTRGGGINDAIGLNFNGLATNFTSRRLYGDGGSAYSDTEPLYPIIDNAVGSTANTFSNIEFYIPNYTSSNNKSFSGDGVMENNGTAYATLSASLWSNTAAITSITIKYQNATSFNQYTSAYLYGISSNTATQNSDGPYAFGGDTIIQSGGYWIHTFLNSNSFTPQKNLTCDYLVIAGGGAGGRGGGGGGGGGAGGYKTSIGGSALSLISNTPYICTVGAGGAGVTSGSPGNNGSNSVFSTITSTGGGGGGGSGTISGNSGGSGGGAAAIPSGTAGATASPSGQGNNGGSGFDNTSSRNGGGGGGSGSAGSNGVSGTAGAGGNGTASSITGTSVTRAGGGGGGAGTDNGTGQTVGAAGSGGGGAGGSTGPGNGGNATANTGSGGGGAGYTYPGSYGNSGNGGSGIIIVRYPV